MLRQRNVMADTIHRQRMEIEELRQEVADLHAERNALEHELQAAVRFLIEQEMGG